MPIDPKRALHTASARAQRTRKTAGRLMISGLGFSAAYFFDAEHGKARRQQLWDLVDHFRLSRQAAKRSPGGQGAPPLVGSHPGAPVERSANGVRATAP
jgi:hypothetical protein